MKNRIALSLPVLLFFAACVPSQSPAQQSSETVRNVVSQVAPQYPSLARSMNIRGSVRVEVSVAPNGTVKTLEVRGGHPVLVEAAQSAVRQWKWEPALHETRETSELRFNPQQ
jgi:TonB family protein